MTAMDVRVDPTWEVAMGETFGHLRPGGFGAAPTEASGVVCDSTLGRAHAFDVRGTPQMLSRTPSSIRRAPADPLKLCIQRAGVATLRQGDNQVRIGPGEMALYDTGRPYDLRLEGSWRCSVLTVPRAALGLPWSRLVEAMSRAMPSTRGPASLLTSLIDAAVGGLEAGERVGEAGVHLLAAALDAVVPERDDDDAVRAAVRAWIRIHAGDEGLTHDAVARAHHMSPRTLHRIFDTADQTVSELIRETRLVGVRTDLADPAFAHRSIMAIASRWGFRDQAHLTRAFRAAFGTTPAAFRRTS